VGFVAVLVLWARDIFYCSLIMTENIESTMFHVVPTGVQLTKRVSMNFPWLSRYEWHAFSLFENPAHPAKRQIFMESLGD
jgi:ferric-chelate reductase